VPDLATTTCDFLGCVGVAFGLLKPDTPARFSLGSIYFFFAALMLSTKFGYFRPPAFAAAFGVNRSFSIFFGGTSLLILVAVVLDTLAQIESYLLMRRYDGLVKSGKVQGRQTGSRLQGIGSEM
jgi:hypothetical protein